MTTETLNNALAFAAAEQHDGDVRAILVQAVAACRTLADEINRREAMMEGTPLQLDVVDVLPAKAVQIQAAQHPGDHNSGPHTKLFVLLADGSIWVQYLSFGNANVPEDGRWYSVVGRTLDTEFVLTRQRKRPEKNCNG